MHMDPLGGVNMKTGHTFDKLDDVWEAYMKYALYHDFLIASPTSGVAEVRDGGERKCRWTFRCCAKKLVGLKEDILSECPAHICVEQTPLGQWKATSFEKNHNHGNLMGRKFDHYPARHAKRQRVSAGLIMEDDIECSKKAAVDFEQLRIDRWIMSFFGYKQRLGERHKQFCNMKLTTEGRCLAWLEPYARHYAGDFSNWLYIDTSSEMVAHVPYILLISVPVDSKKKVIGGACMEAANVNQLEWAFSVWARLLRNEKPKNVICSWNKNVDEALAKAYGDPRRVYPKWKITYEIRKNFTTKLKRGCYELINEIERARTAIDEGAFKKIWKEISDRFGVSNCPLMKHLFMNKEKWAIFLEWPWLLSLRDSYVWDNAIAGNFMVPYMEFSGFLHVYKQLLLE